MGVRCWLLVVIIIGLFALNLVMGSVRIPVSDVVSILMGARQIRQLEQNLASYETVVPDDLMDEIERLSDPLKEAMGTNADLWEGNGGRFY